MNTQDQINEKMISLVIKGNKLTAKILAKAIMLLLKQGKKQIDNESAIILHEAAAKALKAHTGDGRKLPGISRQN